MNSRTKTEKWTTTRLLVILMKVAVILYFVTGKCCGKLVKKPVNATVFEGERTILECETDFHDVMHTIFWKFGNEDIFYGGAISLQYASMFGIQKDHTKGIYNLIIPNATKSHSGRYTCADDEGDGEKSVAWLTVTESPTTEANGNIGASTGTDAVTIIIIVVGVIAAIVLAVIIVVVCIWCWKKRRRFRSETKNGEQGKVKRIAKEMEERDAAAKKTEPKNKNCANPQRRAPGEQPVLDVESDVQTQGTANIIPSAPDNTDKKNEEQGKVKRMVKDIDAGEKLKPIPPTHEEPENSEPGEMKKQLESVDENEKINENINADPGNAPVTSSDLPQENAESNSTHTVDDALLDDSESALLEPSSAQNQTSEQKKGEDIEDNQETSRYEGKNESTPLM